MAGRRAVQTVPKLISLIRKSPTTALLKPDRSQALPSLRRSFSGYHRINPFRFEEVTESGFTVNGIYYDGSLICVGNSITSWAPTKVSEITPESLSMFQTIRPTPEEFILGCGRYETPLSPELRRYIRDIGMKLVVMGSDSGASLYNRQCTLHMHRDDGVIVAAALLPHGCVVADDEDFLYCFCPTK